jgi:putative nucleotidyltransferase with HDIG domain
MKKNSEHIVHSFFSKIKWKGEMRIRPLLISLGTFLACAIFILSGIGTSNNRDNEIKEFEVGKVAERDVIANRDVTYIDENAVVKGIFRGEPIIRRGFIVNNEDIAQLNALNISSSQKNTRNLIGQFFVLFFVYVLFFLLLRPKVIGRKLEEREIYFIAILSLAYVIGSVLISSIRLPSEAIPCSVLIPTALAIMLPALLIGQPAAIAMTIVLPLASFAAGAFDMSSYLFAVISGFSAAFILQAAERRMDLIKAGFINAAVNCAAMAAILLYAQSFRQAFVPILFLAAFNGIFSGMLVLGILPLFEQILNSATTFRLIELSDLNNPILKRLLTVAPGTYSHSVMAANLAENACQDIGANALLARVGAYYHDIGKMDQPDYFVENQAAYNKHTDINPRLSVTVIRSHVKIGVEKGRAIGLPPQVIDIIAQHHGNSVITWFYNEALKKEGNANIEDFTYPGNPPHSREAAVVMLADVVEAAVRSLKKPSAGKIEKFIQELIKGKFDMGQLSESELTFKDLETIKNAFVRVLAGHYHSRIEYPKLKEAVNE